MTSPERPSRFPSLLRGAKAQRERANESRTGEKSVEGTRAKPWLFFRKNMKDYLLEGSMKGGFSIDFPNIETGIKRAISSAHERGQKAIMVDIMGEADGKSLGADTTICLALSGTRKDTKTRKTVAGNAFERHTQIKFLETLDQEEGDIVFANFMPVGGFTHAFEQKKAGQDEYTALQLYELFNDVYLRLASPGIFTIQTSAVPPEFLEQFFTQLKNRGIKYKNTQSRIMIEK